MAHPLVQLENFTYENLNKELSLTADEKDTLNTYLKAYLDDFWQEGKGSLLPATTGKNSSVLDTAFKKRFVFRNIIRECTSRVSGAFYGKAPNWKFQVGEELKSRPREGDKKKDAQLTEIDKALGDFWTSQNAADELSKAFESRLAFGRGGVRIYIPTKFKRKNLVKSQGEQPQTEGAENPVPDSSEDLVKFKTIQEAIAAMRIEFIPPTEGRVLNDGGEKMSLVKYGVRKDWATSDVVNVIEFSFVDNADRTFIGIVEEKGTVSKVKDADLSSGFDLNEGTTYNEFKGLPYVTAGLYKNNQLANLALTCAGFSLVDNGFGEMVLTNVNLPTRTVIGEDGEEIEVPDRIMRGGGTTNNFMGLEEFDETSGATRVGTPGIHFKDPSPLTAFKDGYDLAYLACLQEACQLYALISGDATASGESRIQALMDFLLRIMKYKSEVDAMGGWLLTTVLLWAAALSSKSLENYSVVYDSRVHIANLSSDERTAVMEMRKSGVISRETERVLLGVDDPELEAELILTEQRTTPTETTIEEFSERLNVGMLMQGLGIDNQTIQKFLGYTDTEIAEMERIAAENEAEMLAQITAAGDNQGGAPPPSPADASAATG